MKIKYFLPIIIALLSALLPLGSKAQHGVSYNQFGQLRNSFVNSLSTMDAMGSFSLLGRTQWMGVDGAPNSIWATGNMTIAPISITAGFDAKHASIGVSKETEFTVYAAKAVQLTSDEYISLSMGGGFINYQGNYSQLDGADPAFSEDVRQTKGSLSISTSYYKRGRYYAGVSMPRFTLGKKNNQEYEFRNVFYITGGALFELDESFHLRPSLLVGHMDDMGARYDVSVLLFMQRKFGVGIGMQNQADMSALLQFNYGDFGIGYSYQFSPKSSTMNQRISNNTHEFGVRYRIGGIGLL